MHAKLRRLARQEKLIDPYLQRKKEQRQAEQELGVKLARDHAMTLAALVLYGDPKLEEPLELAFGRFLKKFTAGLRLYVCYYRIPGAPSYIFESVLEELPAGTEAEKYQYVFDRAPLWLLKFTLAGCTAYWLGLKCPDLSGAPREGQTALSWFPRWPNFPAGTLQDGGVQPLGKLTDEERTQFYEFIEELFREVRTDMINEGVMPSFKPPDAAPSTYHASGSQAVRSRRPERALFTALFAGATMRDVGSQASLARAIVREIASHITPEGAALMRSFHCDLSYLAVAR